MSIGGQNLLKLVSDLIQIHLGLTGTEKTKEALRTRGQNNTGNTRPAYLAFLPVVFPQRWPFLEQFISAAAWDGEIQLHTYC